MLVSKIFFFWIFVNNWSDNLSVNNFLLDTDILTILSPLHENMNINNHLFICLAAVAALACTISCDKNDSEEQIDDVTAIKKAVSLATAEVRIRVRGGGMLSGTGVFIDQGDGLQIGEKQKLCTAIYTSGANDIDPDKIESVEIFERGIEARAISVANEGFQMIAQNTALCMLSKADVMKANSDIRPMTSLRCEVPATHRMFMVDFATLGDDKILYVKQSEEVANNMEPLKNHILLTIATDVSKMAYYAMCIEQVKEIKADGPEGEALYKLEKMMDFVHVLN